MCGLPLEEIHAFLPPSFHQIFAKLNHFGTGCKELNLRHPEHFFAYNSKTLTYMISVGSQVCLSWMPLPSGIRTHTKILYKKNIIKLYNNRFSIQRKLALTQSNAWITPPIKIVPSTQCCVFYLMMWH